MIDKLSDQEKSVLLAKAMGWKHASFFSVEYAWETPLGEILKSYTDYRDLYDPANMALAWKALQFAYEAREIDDQGRSMTFYSWWFSQAIYVNDPADAQRLFLDKVLELAIEAGLIELD